MIQRSKTAAAAGRSLNTPTGRVVKPVLANVVVKNTNPSRAGMGRGRLDAATGVQFLEYTLDNSGGASNVVYVIGDAYGQAVANGGLTVSQPTSTTSGNVAGQKALFGTNPMQVKTLQMQTSSNASQFSQPIRLISTEQDGQFHSVPIRTGPFASSSDYNDLIRTVDVSAFKAPVVLGPQSGITISVLAGQSLYVALEIQEQIIN